MKTKLIIAICLTVNILISQEIKIKLWGKYYDVCTSFATAKLYNKDSVKGFSLQSKGYKDFPMEILKYKNIRVIDLSSKGLDEMIEYLNYSERKVYNKRKKNGGDLFGYPRFRPNTLLTIPNEIVDLKKLEIIYLDYTCVTLEEIKKIELLLPNVTVVPSSEELKAEADFFKQELPVVPESPH